MHKVQVLILKTLRRQTSATFSTLMRPTGMLSDTFKFHVQKLLHLGYIEKTTNGAYRLTASGKEFANNIDDEKRTTQKQPKLSIMLVVTRQNQAGDIEYLMQRRQRQPFMHFWGFLSGPVQWGELPEATAHRELHKQTGLDATFTIKAFYRQRDYQNKDALLEDKLFAVMLATNPSGQLSNTWSGGLNTWQTVEAIAHPSETYFPATLDVLGLMQNGRPYLERSVHYEPGDY